MLVKFARHIITALQINMEAGGQEKHVCAECKVSGAVVEETCVTSPSSGSQPWTDLKAQAYFIAEKDRIWSSKQMDTFQKIHDLQQSLNRVAHFLPPALFKVMVNVITDIKADAQQEQNKHSD